MESLGIDIKLIVVQIVNFGLMFFILKKILYRPLLEVIRKRREDLSLIEKRKLELEKKEKEIKERQTQILASAQREKKEIILSAKREAEVERKRIIEKANKQAKEILAGTKRQIERDKR